MLAITRRTITDRLRRPLRGKPDPVKPTGELAVVAAIEQGRADEARAAIAAPPADLGDDFVRLLSRLLVAQETPRSDDDPPVKRYEVDVPMPIWHQIARQSRLEQRPIRRLLSDYLIRGWEDAQTQRQEALDARRAVRDELAAVRTACQILVQELRAQRRS